MFNNFSPAFFSLSSTFVAYNFSLNDDVIDVCGIEDVKKTNNSTPT
jgi:hypothetical protein